ncbi:hypothetical protein TSAR_002484 [Trichomalopsis sarcophagae]|uniref:Uncharacterized protein n=1 Tax=Trichomalopsis sarcophagae TaxID=543379 RepID=A0A232F9U8_9HYME|nr:hypothetical protein TSAR_002484 [Trichomalopsis sarcophagae]
MASMNLDCDLTCSSTRHQQSQTRRLVRGEFDAGPAKCRYNSGVLVGDWFERRANYEPPEDDWYTVYDETYTCKFNSNLLDDKTAAKDNKIKAERGLGGEFLINHHGKSFHGNYTTTNDLFFRVIPRGVCGPRTRAYSSRKDKWLPEIDLTKNFGNLTKYDQEESCKRFEPPGPVKRFLKPKGITDESYLLCHLDIDPSLPFRPHLIKRKD